MASSGSPWSPFMWKNLRRMEATMWAGPSTRKQTAKIWRLPWAGGGPGDGGDGLLVSRNPMVSIVLCNIQQQGNHGKSMTAMRLWCTHMGKSWNRWIHKGLEDDWRNPMTFGNLCPNGTAAPWIMGPGWHVGAFWRRWCELCQLEGYDRSCRVSVWLWELRRCRIWYWSISQSYWILGGQWWHMIVFISLMTLNPRLWGVWWLFTE